MDACALVLFSFIHIFWVLGHMSACLLFFVPQPITDAYIQVNNQSYWCSSHLNCLCCGDTDYYGKIFVMALAVAFTVGCGAFLRFLHKEDVGPAFYMSSVYWLFSLCGFVVCIANLNIHNQSLYSINKCVPIEEIGSQLIVWSNSEWNSTSEWLKHAARSDGDARRAVGRWFLGVLTSCFVAHTIAWVLFVIDFDPRPEEEEPPEAEAVNIDQ